MRGIIIAGTHSGCGKTTVTLGVMSALRARGLVVQPFKCGPDYIDAGLHRIAAGRASRNLDLWMCKEGFVQRTFLSNSIGSDISVIEGVMGLYDGDSGTAGLAVCLDIPVILVIDAFGMAESAGAVVAGFCEYGRKIGGQSPRIVGVIFNRVASENHLNRLKASVKEIPVLGRIARDVKFEIPHRHLGLSTAEESPLDETSLAGLAKTVEEHIDLDAILSMALSLDSSAIAPDVSLPATVRIGVAMDKAFNFYYQDNLDVLRSAGAEIVPFSPIADKKIPDCIDALYIGGGYPELYARELSSNHSMLGSINEFAKSGGVIYAECGGLMYLSSGIMDLDGLFHGMAGIFSFETEMNAKRARLGYREATLKNDSLFGAKGRRLRGHEFHYSSIRKGAFTKGYNLEYKIADGYGQPLEDEGYRTGNVLASYTHLHFGSSEGTGESFIEFIKGARR